MRDLRVYAQPLDGRLSHYRDSNGLELIKDLRLRFPHLPVLVLSTSAEQEEWKQQLDAFAAAQQRLLDSCAECASLTKTLKDIGVVSHKKDLSEEDKLKQREKLHVRSRHPGVLRRSGHLGGHQLDRQGDRP